MKAFVRTDAPSDETNSSFGGGGTVAVAYDLGGRGDGGFNDLAYAGAKAAADAQGAESTAQETDTDEDRVARLELLVQRTVVDVELGGQWTTGESVAVRALRPVTVAVSACPDALGWTAAERVLELTVEGAP